MFLFTLKLLVFVVLLYILLSQITLPAIMGRPVFPIFRKARNDAIDKLKEANASEEDLSIEKERVEKEQVLEEMRGFVNSISQKTKTEEEKEQK